tara:strand:+ start:252 stop:677 length:426 start_codon:yes stop_codon:yes gene_type:complete
MIAIDKLDVYSRWSIVTVVTATIISILTRLLNANINATYSTSHLKRARSLVTQAIYWYDTSEQDTNPLFAMKHSDYAIAYLNAARSMLPDNILEKTCNVDIHELTNTLETHQREQTKAVTGICPNSNPGGSKTRQVNWMKL